MPHKDPAAFAAYHADYREKHRDKQRKYGRSYRAKNRAKLRQIDRDRHRIRVHGISNEHWCEILEWQDNKCACCGSLDPGSLHGWHTDHDHDTEVIRGILCFRCNRLLGALGDNATNVVKRTSELLHYLASSGDLPKVQV